jgi:lipoate-protein ligase A
MDPWRLILDPPLGGAENMAVDEAILRTMEACVEEGAELVPTLRLYSWLEPTVSIGYMQNAGPFIKLASADEGRVPFVRRITGGRAVLHDMEITYSLICPSSHPLFAGGILEAYKVVSGAIAGALNEFGVLASFERGSFKREGGAGADKEACFLTTSRYEVVAGSSKSDGGVKKIAGSSQRRFKGAFLQHGSIILDVDKALTSRVFGTRSAEEIGSVSDFTELDSGGADTIKGAFIEQLTGALDAEFFISKLSAPENNLMRELKEEKYASKEWNEHNTDKSKEDSRFSN